MAWRGLGKSVYRSFGEGVTRPGLGGSYWSWPPRVCLYRHASYVLQMIFAILLGMPIDVSLQ